MYCALCLKETDKLVKSHIISQAINKLSLRTDDHTPAKIVSSACDAYPKKSPTGVYDRFVCLQCEKIFQRWEADALQLFKKAYMLQAAHNKEGILLENFNYAYLKLFFISLLWKADATKHDMFKVVNVGAKHREKLRNMILREDPGSWNDYAVIMERFNSDRASASIMRSVQKGEMYGIRFYTFYMASFKIHIKCDAHTISPVMKQHCLNETNAFIISLIPFESSREFQEYKHTVTLHRDKL